MALTQQYAVNTLVYFEIYEDMLTAISREKLLKGITRAKKIGKRAATPASIPA